MIVQGDLRGERMIGRAQCVDVTSHHTFFTSVHVARSTVEARCRLRFSIT